jgi:hypothetical protein
MVLLPLYKEKTVAGVVSFTFDCGSTYFDLPCRNRVNGPVEIYSIMTFVGESTVYILYTLNDEISKDVAGVGVGEEVGEDEGEDEGELRI